MRQGNPWWERSRYLLVRSTDQGTPCSDTPIDVVVVVVVGEPSMGVEIVGNFPFLNFYLVCNITHALIALPDGKCCH